MRTQNAQQITRRPNIKILIDCWDWDKGQIIETVDITDSVISYQFQKTIKTPLGGGTVTLVPLTKYNANGVQRLVHIMDSFNVMDVVRIYEFGILKFQGYIRQMGANGSIAPDGKPVRNVILQMTHIGGLFAEAEIGYRLVSFRMLGSKFKGIEGSAVDFIEKIARMYDNGSLTFGELLVSVTEEWLNFVAALGADIFRDYITHYIDYSAALQSGAFDNEIVIPKEGSFFYSAQSGDVSFWNEVQKMMEMPFNEIFFDEGPRKVVIKDSEGTLPKELTYLIGRPTPFNNRVLKSNSVNYFNNLKLRTIPLSHLIQWDFTRSIDEMSSLYVAQPTYMNLNDYTLMAMGDIYVDKAALNKYLCKVQTVQLFYERTMKKSDSTIESSVQSDLQEVVSDAMYTLYNWFKDNDKYLSGVITMMVMDDSTEELTDIRMGDRVALQDIDGEFYVEGITHSWSYGVAMTASLHVVRGWGSTGPVQLQDAIFVGGGFYSERD